ncbi:MAG: hypothetical protein EB084_20320, partial [Proteobacteria bacterium]|nr:hypothetical protein [Pseudomonadota bacterium]
ASPASAPTCNAPVALASLEPASAPVARDGVRSAASREVAEQCHAVVFGKGTLEEKTDAIAGLLNDALPSTPSPEPSWTKATPEQIRLFVMETLEHTAGIRRLGDLRGLDFSTHDFDGDTSKFNPEITQFLAKPGRDESVKWAIHEHNATDHHALWNDPSTAAADLKESASDVINAWRMTRRVYDKPGWSWEKIEAVIEADHDDGKLTSAQREALIDAIPFQKQLEAEGAPPA